MPKPENVVGKGWKAGESGNPAGRPKGALGRKTLLRKWADVKSENGTVEDEVILSLLTQARKGNVTAIIEVLDTLHGKLVEKSEVAVTELAGSADDVAKRYVQRTQAK